MIRYPIREVASETFRNP